MTITRRRQTSFGRATSRGAAAVYRGGPVVQALEGSLRAGREPVEGLRVGGDHRPAGPRAHPNFELDLEGGRAYDIRLHVPQGDAPSGGHALLWLLDAPTTWAPMQQALHEAGDPGVVVVGIDWAVEGGVDPSLRRRDFTLPARDEVPPPRGDDDWTEDGDAVPGPVAQQHQHVPRHVRRGGGGRRRERPGFCSDKN